MSLKESYSGPEQDYMISPFPEFTNTTLPMEFSTLPTIEDQQEETSAEDSRPGCGAAGCPLSCSCQSAQLFSLNGQTSTPPDLPSPGAPSLLSLTAPRADDSPRSLSSYSPSTPSDRPTIEDMQPTCTPSPPPHNQVERLRELLTDASPSLTSSMPNLAGSYKAESQLSSRRPIPSRSLESSSASLTTQPISVPSVQPSASVTPEVTTAISLPFQPRSGLSSASRAAYALESAQRLNKEKQKAERERKRAERLEEPTVDESSRNPSRPVSGVLDAPADSNNATSKSHSYYDATGSKGHYQSYHGTGAESQRSSYSNPSQLTSKMEARSSRPKHESYYSAGTDGDRSPYPNPSSGSSKTENRASRSNSRVQQEGSSQGSGMEPERSSYSNPSLLSSKMESHASRSSSRVQQEASNNASVSADRPNPPPIPTSSKPESRASRSSSKTQQDSQSSTKSYIPIQRDSYNYNSVSASASSSYRDYDSAMYANTPPTASNLSRQSSSSMTSMQTKPTTSSTNAKDSSNSYRQYSSSSGKNKLVPTSSLSASIGYAHA
ncbi:hypothetical protein K435DRAFT_280150 [Dendrothele bispora CBS 962.96]|uniref:Uncharacterized protein n=1 Tax=Dendrothele bispora (strain CBS 962.96) TaxID=1314807 RepID=A0A4V4HHP4_DENBC|nr:hypothetical protein K435DRAFT_280150 [Dendrothele bispora CBS 962.96]